MRRFRFTLMASLLTLSISSVALGGNIGGMRTTNAGNIGGLRMNAAGNIGGLQKTSGNIGGLRAETEISTITTGLDGNIGGLLTLIISALSIW